MFILAKIGYLHLTLCACGPSVWIFHRKYLKSSSKSCLKNLRYFELIYLESRLLNGSTVSEICGGLFNFFLLLKYDDNNILEICIFLNHFPYCIDFQNFTYLNNSIGIVLFKKRSIDRYSKDIQKFHFPLKISQ